MIFLLDVQFITAEYFVLTTKLHPIFSEYSSPSHKTNNDMSNVRNITIVRNACHFKG